MSDLTALFLTVKLPVMTEVSKALVRSFQDEDISIGTIHSIVSKDPALTTKILRMANSAGYRMPREVKSLEDAVAMVGLSQIRTLALSACINEAFPVISGLDRQEFWKNSMACAGFSKWLAGGAGLDIQQAWLAGMMVRLGELLIGEYDPSKLVEIERQPHIPGQRWRREQELLGYTETQVTAELARRWNFPEEIVQGLEAASDPLNAKPFNPLGGVIHLAGWLAEMPFSEPIIIDAIPADVIEALKLDPDWLRQAIPQPDSFFDISELSEARELA